MRQLSTPVATPSSGRRSPTSENCTPPPVPRAPRPRAANPVSASTSDWDPRDEYWGEPGQPLPSLLADVIDADVRPCFEMEQVLPGVDEDDWDSDPIIEATGLHHAGLHRDAIRVLDDLLTIDRRCVDAWAHLGLIAFETRGPAPARELYEVGVAIVEASLPRALTACCHAGTSTTGRS